MSLKRNECMHTGNLEWRDKMECFRLEGMRTYQTVKESKRKRWIILCWCKVGRTHFWTAVKRCFPSMHMRVSEPSSLMMKAGWIWRRSVNIGVKDKEKTNKIRWAGCNNYAWRSRWVVFACVHSIPHLLGIRKIAAMKDKDVPTSLIFCVEVDLICSNHVYERSEKLWRQ